MARPHIEFVQSQNVAWSPAGGGAEIKRLNADPDSTDATTLLRLPAGWREGAGSRPARELFVLDGEVAIEGAALGRHGYAFLPPGPAALASAAGATLIVFTYAGDDPDAAASPPLRIDTPAMPWDVSTFDPKLVHLRIARKVLRLGPNASNRTWLMSGPPHGRPAVADIQVERHDHAEEMFMIAGEMSAPEGVMTAGAYFYRPAGIDHGPHVSDLGFFMIMRSPGADRVVTHWQDARRPPPLDPPFRPVLPPGTPASWASPRSHGVDY